MACSINSHGIGKTELEVSSAKTAPTGQMDTTAAEFLNPVVRGISNIEISSRIPGYTKR